MATPVPQTCGTTLTPWSDARSAILAHFAEAARPADIGLDDVNCSGFQHFANAVAAMPGFAARNRNRLPGTNSAVGVQLLRNDRFLEPVDAQRCGCPADFARLQRVIAMIGVDHQTHVRSDDRTHGFNDPQILVDVKPDLDLDGVEALLAIRRHLLGDIGHAIDAILTERTCSVSANALAEAPAEKQGDGNAEVLALDVPERDVDAGKGGDGKSALTLIAQQIVELAPDFLGFKRIAANQRRGIGVDDGGIGLRGAKAFAPADRSVIANDFNQTVPPAVKAHGRALERLVQPVIKKVRANGLNLHVCGARSVGRQFCSLCGERTQVIIHLTEQV